MVNPINESEISRLKHSDITDILREEMQKEMNRTRPPQAVATPKAAPQAAPAPVDDGTAEYIQLLEEQVQILRGEVDELKQNHKTKEEQEKKKEAKQKEHNEVINIVALLAIFISIVAVLLPFILA